MMVNTENETLVENMLAAYGDGADGSSPTAAQWQRLATRPADKSLVLVNLFKLRAQADYLADYQADYHTGDGETLVDDADAVTGQQAFARYSAVSMPAMAQAGGRFLHVGPYEGGFLGEDENWHMVAIGQYPDMDAFWKLYRNADYIAAFAHRRAACARQKVMVLS